MGNEREVSVPDIGEFEGVEVIEVLVSVGDRVEAEQSLITLESEKASMEIPSPAAGVVAELAVRVGSRLSQGDLILHLEATDLLPERRDLAPTVQSMMDGPKHYLTYGQYAKHREKIIVNT